MGTLNDKSSQVRVIGEEEEEEEEPFSTSVFKLLVVR